MWILLTAVVSASLLGSMHCVGMCGPLAIWASGAGEHRRNSQIATASTLYHFGRLLTYMLAGLLAGLLGGLADIGGEILGVQMVAAKLVGGAMILIGAFRLWPLIYRRATRIVQPDSLSKPSLISRFVIKLRPHVFRLPLAARGLAAGLLTAFLPCGWLYLFALVAAGTASVVMGPLVMLAFWLGTVPALVGLVAGTHTLAYRFQRIVPTAAAVLLIVGGCYTASGRGFAQLKSLAEIQLPSNRLWPAAQETSARAETAVDVAEELKQLVQTPLPCCQPSVSDVLP